jgi:hypothetical protein
MSILGKVLAVLNVLAAIAFLCFVGLDYGKRQAWMFAVLQEDFIIKGLPVDENEKDVDGRPLVNAVGATMQKRVFEGLNDPKPVKTQKAEVENRYKALRAEIEEAPNPQAKRKIIEDALVPLARTWGQRTQVQRQIRDPKTDIAALLGTDGPLDAAFREALEGKTVSDQVLGFNERRQAIAHLLFNLNDKPEDHGRALRVVGLEAYTHEVGSQATALENMAPQIQAALEADLTAFEVEHKKFIAQIVVLAERVRHLDENWKKQTLSAQHHKTLVAARKADVENVRSEIAEAAKATQIALDGQSRLEHALFQANQAIAAAADKNQQLLQQINHLELGR